MKPSIGSVFTGVATMVVVVAVGAGIFVLGAPSEERERRTDDRRVEDLRTIKAGTDLFWTRHARVPESLEDLVGEPGVTVRPDPVTALPYEYQALDGERYRVCAIFDGPSDELSRRRSEDLWAHGAGRQCFELDARDITEDRR